jgi:xylose isomerase
LEHPRTFLVLLFYYLYTSLFRDIAPVGQTIEDTNKNLEEITDLALELMNKTGVKLLWATCNFFAHPR